jgi:hypothetical protein
VSLEMTSHIMQSVDWNTGRLAAIAGIVPSSPTAAGPEVHLVAWGETGDMWWAEVRPAPGPCRLTSEQSGLVIARALVRFGGVEADPLPSLVDYGQFAAGSIMHWLAEGCATADVAITGFEQRLEMGALTTGSAADRAHTFRVRASLAPAKLDE